MKHSLLAMVSVVFLLMALGVASADVYIESEQVSQGSPGQTAPTTTILKSYLSQDATRTDMQGRTTIIDFNTKMLYDLDPVKKTYTQTSIEKMGMSDEKSQELANNPMYKTMMQAMSQSAKVTPTNETKTIEGYKCKKYLVTIMMAQADYWSSKDVKGYDEMKAIGEKTAKLFESNPMLKQTNILGLMKELDGYPVQTVTKVMSSSTTTTLKKIETKKLDKELFKVPKEYKLVKEK
ncbi:MAG: DUF4412 domain-containing protein [Desulfobacteraceae bacterium]|nr:DUF4412 domain-containing protein [Desulfobacteraceae bacterium]